MSRLACLQMARLVDRRAAGLTDSERLLLEDHLAECSRCHQDAQLVARLAAASERAAAELSSPARERVIDRALREGAPSPVAAPARALWKWPLVAGAAAAVVLVVALWKRQPVPANTPLTIAATTTLSLAHARVTAAGGSTLEWRPEEATVVLAAGAVDVVVDPAPHRPFRVRTPRFTVDVLGTEFHVELASVQVTHGRVRVTSADGVAELAAGQSWSLPVVTAAVAAPASEPEQAASEPTAPPEPGRHRPRPNAARLLVQAREDIAAHELERADAEITQALAARPSRAQQAEAWTLRADRAQVAGDVDGAARLYLEAAARFADLPAGELALFAAARLELKAQHADRAGKMLREYLRRYPQGRFRDEAKARLSSLGKP